MAKGLINKIKKTFKMTSDETPEKDIVDESEAETNIETNIGDKSSKKSSSKKKSSKAKVEELEQELSVSKDKYLRLFAEFENYKKRNTKERLELMSTAGRRTIEKILPVLDDFDRAKKSAEDENTNEQLSEGILMVYNKLYSVMENLGVTPMETTEQAFDPEFHEAITEIPAPSDEMKGKIIDTVERGYLLNDKIIRFAKVVVGK